jgi:hypothetical protein
MRVILDEMHGGFIIAHQTMQAMYVKEDPDGALDWTSAKTHAAHFDTEDQAQRYIIAHGWRLKEILLEE